MENVWGDKEWVKGRLYGIEVDLNYIDFKRDHCLDLVEKYLIHLQVLRAYLVELADREDKLEQQELEYESRLEELEEEEKEETMKVATHNGQFHADEVFAVAVLYLLGQDLSKVVRTRDENDLAEAAIVIDVGRVFDPEKGRYDHHQERELLVAGRPRAAFGLVWEYFGRDLFLSEEISLEISMEQHARIDDGFVKAVDFADIGISLSPLLAGVSGVIHRMNAEDIFGPQQDVAFRDAVRFAARVLEDLLREAKKLDQDHKVLTTASHEAVAEGRPYVLLEEYADFFDFEFPEGPMFVVFPSGAGWRTQQIAEEVGSFVGRKPLPSSWAGLEPKEFLELLGSDEKATTDTFVHSALFICGTPSKETAIKAAIAAAKA